MKKKIIALILTIGLLLSCLPITTIAESSAMAVAEDCSATQGSYAYVYLRADNFVNIAALDIEIYYDSSVMSLNYTSNGKFLNSAQVSTNTATSGVIKISAMALNGLTSGTSNSGNRMMTICFKINSDCPVGDYPVVVAVGDAYDNDLNPTTISGVNGTVSVKQATAKSFPVYTTLSSTNVEQADELTLLAYHSSSASYKFASADFTIEYDYDLLKIKSIELDSKLLVEGAVYSINDSYPGMAIISYASTNAISSTNFFKITFEVIANVDAQTSVQIIASDVYDDELTAYSPYTATSSTIFITEKEVVPDYPDFRLESEKFIVGKPSDIFVVLEGNSKVAAADFVVNYDKDVFSINSVTADSNALSSGALIVINNNFNDGQIRFSYIMQNGDFAEDTNLITISATPLISPDEHYTMTSSGIDVCDINFNDVTLDYIVDSDCIFLPTVIEPTCTEDGYTSYDCSCGEAYTAEPTPSLGGHDYGDFVIDIEPTCTEEGSKSRHCSVCDDKTDITVIEANGHSYGDWITDTDPTCTEEGSKYKECSVCGDVVSEVIAENGHSYSTEWTIDIEPTCTEEGSKSHHCTVCGDKTDITVIEANGHSYGDWVVDIEPTCTEPGTATKACSECGDTQFAFFEMLLDSATYPESEHNYSDRINETYNFSYPGAVALSITFSASTYIESNYDFIYIYDANGNLQGKYTGTELAGATITLEGNSFSINLTSDSSRTYYGFSFDSIVAFGEGLEIIKPKGHSYGDWIVDTDPTCTEEGSKYKECSVCGDVVTEEIDANGHKYSTEWTIDIEPTCTEEGSKSRHCTICGDKTDITVIEANGHSYSTEWTIDIEPTCTEEGSKSHHCTVCGDKTDITAIEANGHSYGDWIFTLEPTCTESGAATKVCGDCGDIQDAVTELLLDSETYPESEHNYGNNINETYNFSYLDAVALKLTFSSSTKTEAKRDIIYIYDSNGNLYGKYSGTELAGATITLEGNSFSINLTSDVSATYYGFSFDSIVAVVEDDVIKPQGHKYSDEWTIDIEPTCTEEGSKSHHCTVCGDKTDITAIEANGHSYGDWIVTDEPTCTGTGSKSKECSVCGDVVLEVIAENGHSYSTEWTNDIEPTCTEEGSKSHHCTVCGDKTDITTIEATGHSYGDWITDTDPTCTQEGSKHKECLVCGDVVLEVIAENGHSYSTEWTIDIEPTCTEEGSKSHHCTVCGDKTDITAIEANAHSYGDWIVTAEPTCTEIGSAHKVCGKCNNTQEAAFELILDSSTYPESKHNYANNISETYNFSYPDAVTLKLTFSSSTYAEYKRDFIYIYDANGELYGEYTGGSLSGKTITLEGNSFSIKLTSDGSVGKYGFSFDSIEAVIEDDIIKPRGHQYSEEWTIDIEPTCTEEGSKSHHCTVCGDKTDITAIEVTEHSFEATDVMAAHPHTITYTCSDCGTEKAEDSIDSSCIECMHIVGSENTRIDYDNHLIFTTVQECSEITEIIGVSETAKVIPIASHIFGDYEFFGTGTIISVYDNDVHIGDYTLIVSGDVNGDSVCDVLDCAQVALVKNGHKTLDDVYALAADVNMDEVIDIFDYQDIVNIALAS